MTREQTLWLLGATLAIFILELLFQRHRGIYKGSDHLVNGLSALIGMTVTRPVVSGLVATGLGLLQPQYRGMFAHVPFPVALLLIVVVGEFACYWVHRWAHFGKDKPGLDWLWRLHRTHHSAKYVNVLLVYRVNPFWPFVMPLPWVVGFAIYAGQVEAGAVAIFLFSLWGLVTHSNFRWDDAIRRHRVAGPVVRGLEHVFVSPGIHHSHHGYGRDGGNYRNFGIFLSVFDTAFKTLHIPQGRPFRYGLPGENAHWAEEVFFPFYRKSGGDVSQPKSDARERGIEALDSSPSA